MIAYRSLFSMGTRMEIVLPDVENELADRIFALIREKLDGYEKMLSIYIENSEFSKINSNASFKPFKTTSECFRLISSLITYNTLSLGYFDPTLGLINEDLFTTDRQTINDILKVDFRKRISLDYEKETVMFNVEGVKLDPGGFGKGYALDSLKNILLSHKISNAFISFGDSSVMTLGRHPAGEHWKIGIRDLKDERSNAWVFEMNDGSVSTSGNTSGNSRKTDGEHIFNPFKANFEIREAVVSVQGPSAFEAEILSTALFIADVGSRIKIMENFPQYKAVELVYSMDKNKTIVQSIS